MPIFHCLEIRQVHWLLQKTVLDESKYMCFVNCISVKYFIENACKNQCYCNKYYTKYLAELYSHFIQYREECTSLIWLQMMDKYSSFCKLLSLILRITESVTVWELLNWDTDWSHVRTLPRNLRAPRVLEAVGNYYL